MKKEFAIWQAMTKASQHSWAKDDVYHSKGEGAMYYIGGESGYFMRVSLGGLLTVGTYEGAVPHIGEALFKVSTSKQYNNFFKAFTSAIEVGGKKFLMDMFSGRQVEARAAANRVYDKAGEYTESEKSSILSQLRDAKKLQPVPHKEKNGHTDKGPEL